MNTDSDMIAHKLVAEVTSILWLSNNGNFSVVGQGLLACEHGCTRPTVMVWMHPCSRRRRERVI
jgi:hypothetical protein